ncbi:MAG: GNAT family N-acetyltransferase [Rhodospirillales bacterium]|nr:GNAT family N-acetyltransferase [Rhodospirillales bacterium]
MAIEIAGGIPTLKTERLVLRPSRLDDFPILAEIMCTERSQFVGGPMSREDAWYEFTQLSAEWLLHGHGGWTIEKDGIVCGFVMVGVEPGDHEREVGFLLTEDAEGHGIASEAARAARDYAFEALGFETIVSYIDPKNARSSKVALRLGGERDVEAEAAKDNRMHIYRYPKPEAAT